MGRLVELVMPAEPDEEMLAAANAASLAIETLIDDARFSCERATYKAMVDVVLRRLGRDPNAKTEPPSPLHSLAGLHQSMALEEFLVKVAENIERLNGTACTVGVEVRTERGNLQATLRIEITQPLPRLN